MLNLTKNRVLTFKRGDTCSFPLFINAGTQLNPFRFDLRDYPTAYILFAVMEPNQDFDKAILKKTYTYKDINTNGDVVIKFAPKDTAFLAPGKYYYEIKLYVPADKDSEAVIHTVTPRRELFIDGATSGASTIDPGSLLCLYGELNKEVAETGDYIGVSTETAIVKVNNITREISVDVIGGTGSSKDAVLYVPQVLKEEEQAQARANISAATDLITIFEEDD